MAKTNPSIVYLKSTNRDGTQSFEEATTGGAIEAGMLLALDFSTDPPEATASDGSVAYDALAVSLEKEYDDANTQDAINATYASGEVVRFVNPKPGDVLYVRAGGTIAVGAAVIDGGGTTPGTFITSGTVDATTVTNTLKGKALTAGAAAGYFKMEVL